MKRQHSPDSNISHHFSNVADVRQHEHHSQTFSSESSSAHSTTINVNSSSGIVIGDHNNVTNNYFTNCDLLAAGNNVEPRDLAMESRQQARRDCGEMTALVQLDKPLVPVRLQIASEPVQVDSELEAEGHYRRRKDFLKLYELQEGDLSEEEVFNFPKKKAKEEAMKKFESDNEREEYIEREGNVIGIVGNPGIGKTTSMKKWVMQILNGELVANVTFLFFILVRNIDFSQKVNLLELLISSIISDWDHSQETDKIWLKRIFRDRNVVIALDGFDESGAINLSIRAPRVNLCDVTDPLTLLLNLFSGKLLPFARIVISSRPDQFYNLHADHKPKNIFQILGLDKNSQDMLGRQICKNWDAEIKKILLQNPDVFAYCFVPANFILTVDYLLNNVYDVNFVCMTRVLASACEKYSVSDQLRGKDCELDKLSRLAWVGYRRRQIMFEVEDLKEVNLGSNTHQSFLSISILKSANVRMTIMDGHKRSYFSHLIWQEFFTALYLMLFSSEDEFEEVLQHIFDTRWEVVMKFLFGLCNQSVYCLLKGVTSTKTHGQLWQNKKEKLKNAAVRFTRQRGRLENSTYGSRRMDFQKLMHLCSWVHEASDKRLTHEVAEVLPGWIFMDGSILPSDISNLFYVIGASSRSLTLTVGNGLFVGDALSKFCQGVMDLKEKIDHVHFNGNSIGDEGFSCLFKCLRSIRELMLELCGVSSVGCAMLAEKLIETGHTIQLVDLGQNQIGDEGFSHLAQCLQNIQKLDLEDCGISSAGCMRFAERMIETGHNMQFLSLSGNKIKDEGFFHLVKCVRNIRRLDLTNCGISSAGCMKLAVELIKTGNTLDHLNLHYNKLIGDEGALSLISCLHLIGNIQLSNCRISKEVKGEVISQLQRLGRSNDNIDFVFAEEYEDGSDYDETSGQSSQPPPVKIKRTGMQVVVCDVTKEWKQQETCCNENATGEILSIITIL